MKIIKVSIAPDGKPTIEAEGFQGVGCKAATKPIEDALGNGDKETHDKPEIAIATGQTATGGLYA